MKRYWETDPDEQNFTDLMGTEYMKGELWWPYDNGPPQYSIRIEVKRQQAAFSGNEKEGIAAAEAALRAQAEAVVKELGGRAVWEEI